MVENYPENQITDTDVGKIHKADEYMRYNNNDQFYCKLVELFKNYTNDKVSFDDKVDINCRALTIDEAIGNPERKDYPLLQGKEVLLEADYRGFKGQAYTDSPSNFSGSIKDILNLDINKETCRAVLIATINAVLRSLNNEINTKHCKDEEPTECAHNICIFLLNKGYKKILMLGFQPAIADGIKEKFELIVLDRDKENIGKERNGVFIDDGYENSDYLYDKVDVILSTGSTIVNGSIIGIIDRAKMYNKDLYFYGTTIAGASLLLGLNRLCFKAH